MKTNQAKWLKLLQSVFVFLIVSVHSNWAGAQCGSTISTFPYSEGFETGGAWTSGGTASDWAWGSPAHPTISTAGGGSKSWCVGGLTGTFYNLSQNSYLMSPCFDFSTLNYPWISFKLFWETELKWDGLTFQYSLDGGITWANVGAYGDAEDCLNENWFNHNNISGLVTSAPKHGWSGRVGATTGSCLGGNGSGTWITAKHCMTYLSGQPSVRFRFLFGSGFSCNNYDGIAVDDILIQNAAPNTADFAYTCVGGSAVSFTNLSSPCSTDHFWDFGDPASGSASTSTATSPTHVFSAPGTYTVTLTSFGTCNLPGISTQTVTILSANATGTNVICHGQSNGTATAMVTGSTTGLTYAWNTTPVQTSVTAENLAAGVYTVDVTSPGSCPASATVTINEPTALNVITTALPSCSDICNGTVEALATGGLLPYTYNWMGLGTNANYSGTVCGGSYTLTVTDNNGCTVNSSATVELNTAPLLTCNNALICLGSSVQLEAIGAITYEWFPATGLNTTTGSVVMASPDSTTLYNVYGTSAEGCTVGIDVLVTVSSVAAPTANFTYLPQSPSVYNPVVNFTNTSVGATSYSWNFGEFYVTSETNPSYSFPIDSGGLYNVCLVAINDLACSDTVCQQIMVEGTTTLFVPNAFTPNGDGLNEEFFPVISDVDADAYTFTVYNRWGQVVFQTKSLDGKWDGRENGVWCKSDTYIWKIQYTERNTGIQQSKEGHFSLLR